MFTPWAATWRAVLVKRLSIDGFIIFDHWDGYPEFLTDMAPKVAAGEVAFLEDVAEGLENAPEAFIGLLQGRNRGKQVVAI